MPNIPAPHVAFVDDTKNIAKPWLRFLHNVNPFKPIQPNLTALAGGAQVGATQLNFGTNILVVVAALHDSTILPPASASNDIVFLVNTGAQSTNVYPQVGEATNNGVNQPIAVPSAKCGLFVDYATATWGGGTLG